MKVTFETWEEVNPDTITREVNVFQPKIISVNYDRGKLEVNVNGVPILKLFEGTQDFLLEIDLS